MAYDSSTGILTYPFTKIAADGNGDLQQALGTTLTSQVDLFAFTRNKWAKYQPFADSRVFSDRFSDTSSTRLAALKSANWGFGTDGIPTYSTKTTLLSAMSTLAAGSAWTRTALSTLRALDFDGYVSTSGLAGEWGALGVENGYLAFPFGGLLWCKNASDAGPNDHITSLSLDPSPPDNTTRQNYLLYLSDFASMTAQSASYYNFYDWYLGLALTNSSFSSLYVATCANAVSYFTDGNQPTLTELKLPSGLSSGTYYVFPILTQTTIDGAKESFATITTDGIFTSDFGRAALIDGYRLPIEYDSTKVGLTVSPAVSVGTSATTITVTFTNNTDNSVTIKSGAFLYVTAEAVFDSEDWEYVSNAEDAWRSSGTVYTSGVTNGSGTVVSVYKSLGIGSSGLTLASGASTTITVTISAIKDAQGNAYDNQYTLVDVCYSISTGSYLIG